MRKDFVIYLILLVCGLAAAYYVSLPQKTGESSKVEWVKLAPDSVTAIVYKSEQKNVNISKKDSIDGYVVESIQKAKEDKPETRKRFRAQKKINDILEFFNPLYVIRVIGKVDDAQKEEFGLSSENESLKVYTGDTLALEFVLGKNPYGRRDVYVFDTKEKQVLLIEGGYVADIQKADVRLFERRVFDIANDDFSAIEILRGEQTKRIEHKRRDGSGALKWHDEGSEGAIKATYENWVRKLDNLRIQRMANEDEVSRLEQNMGQIQQAKLTLYESDQPNTTLILLHDSEGNYWVHSSFLGGFAKVDNNRMDTIVKDLNSVLEN